MWWAKTFNDPGGSDKVFGGGRDEIDAIAFRPAKPVGDGVRSMERARAVGDPEVSDGIIGDDDAIIFRPANPLGNLLGSLLGNPLGVDDAGEEVVFIIDVYY